MTGMRQRNSWRKTEDIEIDLADLLHRLCVHWKQAVICAAIIALAFGWYGYIKSSGNTNADRVYTVEDTVLEEEEQQKVTAAAELEEEVRALEEYIDNSVLMQIDPYHKERVAMLYNIEEADYQDLQKILGCYVNFATNGGMADALIKADREKWNMDKSYLAELILAYQKTYAMPYQVIIADAAESSLLSEALFYIEVTGKDKKMAEQLALAVQSELEKYRSIVADKAGKHKLILLSSEKSIMADSSLQTQQHDKRALLTTNLNSLQAMTGAFNEGQTIMYKHAVGLDDEQEIMDDSLTIGKFSFIRKYVIFGFIGGILLYSCLFACLYLVRDTIKSVGEMRRLYMFPVYGAVSLEKGEIARTLNRVRLSCKKQGITKLCAATDFVCGVKEKKCMENIAGQLNEWGIDVFIAENACRDAGIWDALTEAGNVLLVCRTGLTTHRQVDEEMEFYIENGIDVAGAVALDF